MASADEASIELYSERLRRVPDSIVEQYLTDLLHHELAHFRRGHHRGCGLTNLQMEREVYEMGFSKLAGVCQYDYLLHPEQYVEG